MWTIPSWTQIERTLMDASAPIGQRMRAAYYAKQIFMNEQQEDDNTSSNHSHSSDLQDRIVDVLCEQVFQKQHGSLLRHEFAYVLGQMQTVKACQTLETLLSNEDDCVMVRHEAAEALGAIASPSSRTVLKQTQEKYKGRIDEISDTCLLALNRLEHHERQNNQGYQDSVSISSSLAVGCACMLAPFNSIDPAAPDPAHVNVSTSKLGNILLDRSIDLIERYRAMFSLRNRGGKDAVLELCRTLTEDQSSPLLRHEIAFVLGQLQHPYSIDALEESLSRRTEHTMVRHESAEALGAIEGSSDDWHRIEQILTRYQMDDDRAVADSCIVAMDAAEYYWGSEDVCLSTEASSTSNMEEVTKEEQKNEMKEKASSRNFTRQKHSNTNCYVNDDNIRKHILAEHFNVKKTLFTEKLGV